MMKTVGFIGVGVMGRSMVRNLLGDRLRGRGFIRAPRQSLRISLPKMKCAGATALRNARKGAMRLLRW